MSKIFISYRRDESDAESGRIDDRLWPTYGRENVFKDVDTIPLGVDFRRVLTDAVAQCDVMLVVIGRQWLSITDAQRRRRIDSSSDFVRIEVEAALATHVHSRQPWYDAAALRLQTTARSQPRALQVAQEYSVLWSGRLTRISAPQSGKAE